MKKRIITAIFAALLCVISSIPAFATETGGYFTPFDITVTSESGAVLYDVVWNDDMTRSIMRPLTVLAPVGTQLTVTDETEFNGELYLAVEYNDFYAYVKKSKIMINVQTADDSVAYPTDTPRSVTVITKDGVCLRKGPSLAYDTVAENIPYGTVLSYSKVNCEKETYAQWAYTEYNGTKGWLYIYQYGTGYDCARNLSDADRYTGTLKVLTDGAFLTETPDPASPKTAENIPAGTTLSFKYFYEFYDSVSAYVDFNGKKGWLKTKTDTAKTAIGEKGGVYVLAENGIPLYKNAFGDSEKPDKIVPAGTNLCVDYVYRDAGESNGEVLEYKWMHVNFDNTDGWLFSADSSEYCYMQNAFDLKIEKDDGLMLYSAPENDAKSVATVPKGTTVTCIYEIVETKDGALTYWSYVEYNGNQGWIHSTEEEAVFVEGSEKQLDAPFGAEPLNTEKTAGAPEITTKPAEAEKSDDKNTDGDSSITTIIICVCAGAVVAAAVAFIVIKKKKKS